MCQVSGVPIRRTSTSTSRPSMVGKKASSAVGTSKGLMKKNGGKEVRNTVRRGGEGEVMVMITG